MLAEFFGLDDNNMAIAQAIQQNEVQQDPAFFSHELPTFSPLPSPTKPKAFLFTPEDTTGNTGNEQKHELTQLQQAYQALQHKHQVHVESYETLFTEHASLVMSHEELKAEYLEYRRQHQASQQEQAEQETEREMENLINAELAVTVPEPVQPETQPEIPQRPSRSRHKRRKSRFEHLPSSMMSQLDDMEHAMKTLGLDTGDMDISETDHASTSVKQEYNPSPVVAEDDAKEVTVVSNLDVDDALSIQLAALERDKAELEQAVRELSTERDQAMARLASQNKDHIGNVTELDSITEKHKHLSVAHEYATQELSVVNDKYVSLQSRYNTLQDEHRQLHQSMGDMSGHLTELAKLSTAHVSLTDMLTTTREAHTRSKTECQDLRAQLEALQGEHVAVQEERDRTQAELTEHLTGQHEQVSTELVKLKTQRDLLDTNYISLSEQHTHVLSKLAEITLEHGSVSAARDEAVAEGKQLQAEVDRLRAQANSMSAEVVAAKNQITEEMKQSAEQVDELTSRIVFLQAEGEKLKKSLSDMKNERKQLKPETSDTVIEHTSDKISRDQLIEQIKTLQEKNGKLNETLKMSTESGLLKDTQLHSLGVTVETLHTTHTAITRELNDLTATHNTLREVHGACLSELEPLRANETEHVALQIQHQATVAELTALSRMHTELNTQHSTLDRNHCELTKQNEILKQEIIQKNTELTEPVASLKTNDERSFDEVLVSEQDYKRLQPQLHKTQLSPESQDVKHASQAETHQQSSTRLAKLVDELNEVRSNHISLQAEHQKSVAHSSQISCEFAELTKKNTTLSEEYNRIKTTNVLLSAEITQLSQDCANLTEFLQSFRNEQVCISVKLSVFVCISHVCVCAFVFVSLFLGFP